ncbi:peptidoglycan/LPS O-acetylase OafA/YrhL [Arthrobacter sp. SORGH_AS 212]|nr:peptidoglycan/LPS O-acetylase OafA/YrhL [Arthrobacter sp. SORGH_AS_0212]
MAATYFTRGASTDGPLVWWLTHTPLHILWEGDGAVYIFFVLSGVVLALPFLRKPLRAKVFYPHRLLRLYLPIWAAVLFAATTVFFVPRHGDTSNEWLNARVENVTAAILSRDLTLVRGPGGLATPLWSLQWEILFSLALPLYLWLALKLRGHLATKVIVLLGAISASALTDGTPELVLKYMPMFMIGVVMMAEHRTLTRWAEAAGRHSAIFPALFVIGCVLLTTHWWVMPVSSNAVLQDAMIGPMVLGASVLIFASMYWKPLKTSLESAPAQWLGKISFSLYLVHEPIIVTLGYIMGDQFAPLAAFLGFVLSLLLAPLFFLLVERPSHRLAKAIQTKSQARTSKPELVSNSR